MNLHALIRDGVAVDVYDFDTVLLAEVSESGVVETPFSALSETRLAQAVADRFGPDTSTVPAPDRLVIGRRYAGGHFIPPPEPEPPSEAEVNAALVAYAADRRWQIETGGTIVGGVPIATDDRSKIMIMGARVAAAADPAWETVWHGADGQTYPLNAAAMIAISNAVEAHVNATFASFATVKADIEAGEITTFAEIDAAFA